MVRQKSFNNLFSLPLFKARLLELINFYNRTRPRNTPNTKFFLSSNLILTHRTPSTLIFLLMIFSLFLWFHQPQFMIHKDMGAKQPTKWWCRLKYFLIFHQTSLYVFLASPWDRFTRANFALTAIISVADWKEQQNVSMRESILITREGTVESAIW